MKSIANWNKKIALCLAMAMMISASATSVSTSAATTATSAITLSTGENTQVFVLGKTYNLNVANAVSFKSSNTAVATVDATGKVTPKKQGAVTIVATTKNGKKVSKRFVVVNKQGTTAYQTTLDRMLAAENISKIVLKNTKSAEKYVIKAGDYSNKVLYVRAGQSDVRNYATFKNITIVDVADHTWSEYGKNNSFTITDETTHFVAGSSAVVKSLNLAAENQNANVEVRGTVENISVTGTDAKVMVNTIGEVQNVVIDSKSDVVIEGSAKTVKVEVTEAAAGATITSSVPVEVSIGSNVTLTLEKGAEASTVEKASANVSVKVENNTSESVSIGTAGSTTVEKVESNTTAGGTTGGTTIGGTTGGSTGGSTAVSKEEVTGKYDAATGTTTYSLTYPVTVIETVTVNARLGLGKIEYILDKDIIGYASGLLTDINENVDKWIAIDGEKVINKREDLKMTVSGIKGEAQKNVTFNVNGVAVDFVVKVNKEAKTVDVQKATGGMTYTLKINDVNKKTLSITTSDKSSLVGKLSFTVTY